MSDTQILCLFLFLFCFLGCCFFFYRKRTDFQSFACSLCMCAVGAVDVGWRKTEAEIV